jgi:hypothetical protein
MVILDRLERKGFNSFQTNVLFRNIYNVNCRYKTENVKISIQRYFSRYIFPFFVQCIVDVNGKWCLPLYILYDKRSHKYLSVAGF